MPPLTRNRADDRHIVGDMHVEHYALTLRATVPGTLVITEVTYVMPRDAGIGRLNMPGVYSREQVAAWKKVVDAIRAEGSLIYCQIWTVGRRSIPKVLAEVDSSYPYLSAGNFLVVGRSRALRAMTQDKIMNYVQYHTDATRAAVEEAGFDAVEIHGAGGYLANEFLKNFANNRTDEYGGSPQNKVISRGGRLSRNGGWCGRVGVKISPWTTVQGYDGGVEPEDPRPTFGYVAREIRARHPILHTCMLSNLASLAVWSADSRKENLMISFVRPRYSEPNLTLPMDRIIATAIKHAEEHEDSVAFGRFYTSNGYNDFGFSDESWEVFAARGMTVGAAA